MRSNRKSGTSKHFKYPEARWILLGAVVLAMGLRFVIAPWLTRLPFDFHRTIELEGNVNLLESFDLDQKSFPLGVSLDVRATGGIDNRVKLLTRAKFRTLLSEQSFLVREIMRVFLQNVNVRADYWDKLKLAFGDSEIEQEIWVDSRKFAYITPTEAQDSLFTFPPGRVRKVDYQIWDSVTSSLVNFKYQDSGHQNGLDFYRFAGDLGEYDVGSFSVPGLGTRVRVDAKGTATVAVEKVSSLIADFQLDLELYAQSGILELKILTLDLHPTTEQSKSWVDSARETGLALQALRLWLPLLLIISGLFWYFHAKQGRRSGSFIPRGRMLSR